MVNNSTAARSVAYTLFFQCTAQQFGHSDMISMIYLLIKDLAALGEYVLRVACRPQYVKILNWKESGEDYFNEKSFHKKNHREPS